MSNDVTRTFDLLERYEKNFPRQDALGGKKNGGWYVYSTSEYKEKSNQLALGMLALGLEKGDKVATVTTNRPEWNFADMGLAMAGMIHVPIYPTISEEEYRYILNHAEVKYVIVGDKKLFEKINPLLAEVDSIKGIYSFEEVEGCKNYEEILQLGAEKEQEFESVLTKNKTSIEPDDLATLIYTSGTTGVPKGVMLTHRNLVSNFIEHVNNHELGYEHKTISFLPLCHVYERSMNYHFQHKGMGIYYVGNLGGIMPALKEINPDMFNSVPRLLERIYDGLVSKGKDLEGIKRVIYFWALNRTRKFSYNKKFNPFYAIGQRVADKLIYSKWREAFGGNLKIIVSGGAALQPRIARLLGAAGILTLEGYGLTETSPVIAVSNLTTRELKIGTVGPALPGTQIKIAEDGEILCKGPGVMQGYYKAPDLTAEVLTADGWFHTGDIGVFEDGKYLKITDRKKEMFKLSGGKYIAPQMIENKLKESFFIEQAMIIGDNEKFASALISPNFEFLHDWCSQRKIHFRDNEELVQKTEVTAQYQKEVAAINKTLGVHEEIKRFRLVCEEWTPQSGELSPTLKLKRNFVAKKYDRIIAEIYSVSKQTQSNGGLLRLNLRFDMNELRRRLRF